MPMPHYQVQKPALDDEIFFTCTFCILGSDYSGAFRSEEDLKAMDDDIRKW